MPPQSGIDATAPNAQVYVLAALHAGRRYRHRRVATGRFRAAPGGRPKPTLSPVHRIQGTSLRLVLSRPRGRGQSSDGTQERKRNSRVTGPRPAGPGAGTGRKALAKPFASTAGGGDHDVHGEIEPRGRTGDHYRRLRGPRSRYFGLGVLHDRAAAGIGHPEVAGCID